MIDPNENEAWGIVNEKEKEKELEILKKILPGSTPNNKIAAANVQVTKITLEISEADRILNEQKKQIGELEGTVKILKNKNNDLDEKRMKLKAELDDVKKSTDEESKLELAKNEKIKRNNQTKELNDKLKILLGFEHKKRKILDRKALGLQNTMRKSENLVICIDSFYNRCMKGTFSYILRYL